MTRKKIVSVRTDEELVRIFTGQEFKDIVAANLPHTEVLMANQPLAIERFAAATLADARVYIRDAVKPAPKQVPDTDEPLVPPRREAAAAFVMGLQINYLHATGEQPSFTAQRKAGTGRGPFARIARWCLLKLKAPVDDIKFINMLQTRSNKMTDQRGQPRRQRKKPDAPEK